MKTWHFNLTGESLCVYGRWKITEMKVVSTVKLFTWTEKKMWMENCHISDLNVQQPFSNKGNSRHDYSTVDAFGSDLVSNKTRLHFVALIDILNGPHVQILAFCIPVYGYFCHMKDIPPLSHCFPFALFHRSEIFHSAAQAWGTWVCHVVPTAALSEIVNTKMGLWRHSTWLLEMLQKHQLI